MRRWLFTLLLLLVPSLGACTTFPTHGTTSTGATWEVELAVADKNYEHIIESEMRHTHSEFERITGKKVPPDVWRGLDINIQFLAPMDSIVCAPKRCIGIYKHSNKTIRMYELKALHHELMHHLYWMTFRKADGPNSHATKALYVDFPQCRDK